MDVGDEETLTIVTRATATGNFTNEANVTCDEPEWDYDNNYDNATVTISLLPPPNKTADKNRTLLYENVTYNLTVTNVGEDVFDQNLTVIDSLPSGVEYIETIGIINADVLSNATLSNNNKTITWVITNIPKGATAIITVLARATEVGTQVNNETLS